jgi:ribosomal protein S27AE
LLVIFATTGKRDILPRPMKGIREKWEEGILPLNNFKKLFQGKELKPTMTDKGKPKAGKTEYTEANLTAQNMTRDPGVKAQDGSADAKVAPHSMNREVTTSIRQEKLKCPRCGESTLHAEFPDQFEAWVKCSSCDFFMGMSNDDWHRMKNSPNINEKIKKMAWKKDLIKE